MDLSLLTFFNQTLANPLLDGLMVGLTWGGLLFLPLLGLALLAAKPQRRVGLAILLGLMATLILVITFQYLSLRPRPDFTRQIIPGPDFPSFPSGHAALAFCTAVVIALSYRRHRWSLIAFVLAGLIALSRLYLGLHYPTDLLGGAGLGMAAGAAAYGLIIAPYPGQRVNWGWLLWLQIAIALLVSQMAYLDILPAHLLRWPLADKVFHFLLIGSLAFWLNLWLGGRSLPLGRWAVPLAILIPLTIALAEEGVQYFSPIRSASLTDLSSDLLGLFFFWWLSRKLPPAPKPAELYVRSR
jgi:undecaprenyl-diphosphatase